MEYVDLGVEVSAREDAVVATRRRKYVQQHVLTRSAHWLSMIALIVAAATILGREYVEEPALRTFLLEAHRQAGLLVLIGLAARLVIRWRVGLANNAPKASKIEHLAAHLGHLGIYGALLAIPLLGWAVTNAHEVQLRLLGLIPLPSLVAADPDLADSLTDWHVLGSWGLLGLLCAHVAAALWHHHIRKDGVLLGMLPKQK